MPIVDPSVLIEAMAAALVVVGPAGPIAANRAFAELTGVRAEDRAALAEYAWVAEEDRQRFVAEVASQLTSPTATTVTTTLGLRLDPRREQAHWVEAALASLEVDGGPMVVVTLVDNTAVRVAASRATREKERALRTLATIGDGVIRVDARARVEYLNAAAERLTGWPLDEASGRPVAQVYQTVPEVNRNGRRDPVADCLQRGQPLTSKGFATLLTRVGQELVVRDTVTPILEPISGSQKPAITGAVVVFEDVTEVRGLEREMVFLASHDALTGLLNRSELEIHLEATREAVRAGGGCAALLMLDLARFRLVNDAGGLNAGDELLRQVASLLTDTADATALLGRLGGDQFAVLLPTSSPDQARRVAHSVHTAFHGFRFTWGGHEMEVRASIGLVVIDADTESVSEILRSVEEACRTASDAGSHRVHEARRGSRPITYRGPSHWVQRLHRALARNELQLYHQRIAPLRPGASGFHEILVRMVDRDGEIIEPGRFVPVAEQFRLAPTLDRWVVREALRLLRADPDALGGEPITINLSGQSLGDESFLGFIQEQLTATDLVPQRVLFEITETAAVANLAQAARFLGSLRERGFRFVLDDFGSGMSSFGYLKSLPVELLKIDGAFVRTMDVDPLQREMVRSMNEIGHRMGLATIAEWVESEAILVCLQEIGVDYVQGYHVHRPVVLNP